jgi:hypothetical protein
VGHHYFHLNCDKTCRILKTHPQYSGNIKPISNNFIFSISKVFHIGIYALSIPAITTNNLESTEHCHQHFQVTYNSLTIFYSHITSGTKTIPCLPVCKVRIFLVNCFKNHGCFSTCTLQNYPASKMFFTLITSGITRLDNADDNVNTVTLMDAVCSICQHEYITIFF